jgi:hypothetical protein
MKNSPCTVMLCRHETRRQLLHGTRYCSPSVVVSLFRMLCSLSKLNSGRITEFQQVRIVRSDTEFQYLTSTVFVCFDGCDP